MANRVKKFRLKQGLTQEELAAKLKISPGYLSKVERGEVDPSLKLAVRIAKSLRCTLNDLFFN